MQSIINEPKPHFYEYMQIQLLHQYMQKGIKYFVQSLLNSSDKLVSLRYFADEIVLIIDFIKQFIWLNKYGATYAEDFYGLQRQSLNTIDSKKVSKLKILYQTLVMTFLPYLTNKIETYYNQITEQEANEGKILNLGQKIFTKAYPLFYMLTSAIQVLMKFHYLLSKQAKIYNLPYRIMDTKLTYNREHRSMKKQEGMHYPWKDLIKTPGLLTMLIGHKVLTWYFNRKNQRKQPQRRISENLRNLGPLKAVQNRDIYKTQQLIDKRQYAKGICLICGKGLTNPAVIKQNGHVFCYECISQYVKENRKCPITGIRVAPQHLQLIYSNI